MSGDSQPLNSQSLSNWDTFSVRKGYAMRISFLALAIFATANICYGQRTDGVAAPDGAWSTTWAYVPEVKERTKFSVYTITPVWAETDIYRRNAPNEKQTKVADYYLMQSQIYSWKKNLLAWSKKNRYEFQRMEDKSVYFVHSDIVLFKKKQAEEQLKREAEAAKKSQTPLNVSR